MTAPQASEPEAWLAELPAGRREQAVELAELVRDADHGVAQAVKWGRLTFTVDDNWHHWVCAISNTKAELKLTFHKGALLPDPAGVLQGEARYLRHVPYDTAVAHGAAVRRLVQEAIGHQTDVHDDSS